jgi:hypothetical protein
MRQFVNDPSGSLAARCFVIASEASLGELPIVIAFVQVSLPAEICVGVVEQRRPKASDEQATQQGWQVQEGTIIYNAVRMRRARPGALTSGGARLSQSPKAALMLPRSFSAFVTPR